MDEKKLSVLLEALAEEIERKNHKIYFLELENKHLKEIIKDGKKDHE